MDIHEYLGVLRRGLALIVLGTLLGVGAGFAVQSVAEPTYSATSRELLTNKTAGDISLSQSRIASYVLVASSGLVLQPVIDQLGLDTNVDALAARLNVVAPPQTVVIEITATAATPLEAQNIANTVSDVFAGVVADQLETTSGAIPTAATPAPTGSVVPTDPAAVPVAPTPTPTTTTLPNGTVVPIAPVTAPVRVVNLEEATLPSAPDSSNGTLMLLVGGVLGLALGLLLASLREAFDRRVRTPRDVTAVSDVPVIGQIVGDRAVWSGVLVARTGSRAAIAESFRSLRARFDHLRDHREHRSFVVTAAGPGQGATTVTANLAVALANTATSVVVIDADLRGGVLSRIFGVHADPGLTEVLTQRIDLDAALQWGGTSGLTVLPAGSGPVNPGELLATPAMRELLGELRRRFEVVLIDTPTIAAVTDAAVLGSFDSSTLLVIAQGSSTRPKLDDAISMLAAGGGAPVGIVLNRIPRRLPWRRRPAVVPAAARPRESSLPVQALPEQAQQMRAQQQPAERPEDRRETPTVAPAPIALQKLTPTPRDPRDPIVAQRLTEFDVRAAHRAPAAPPAPATPAVQASPSVEPVEATMQDPQPEPIEVIGAAGSVPAASVAAAPAAAPHAAAAHDIAADDDLADDARAVDLPAHNAPILAEAGEPGVDLTPPVFDPPLPAQLLFAGRPELPIGRRTPRHQAATAGSPGSAARDGSAADRDSAFSALPSMPADQARVAEPQPQPRPQPTAPASVSPVATSAEEAATPSPGARESAPVPEAAAPASETPASAPASPDAPPAPASRFAPDMSRWAPDPSVYAVARPPKPGTEGQVPDPGVSGTVVTTISIATSRRPTALTTPPPPISRLLPITSGTSVDAEARPSTTTPSAATPSGPTPSGPPATGTSRESPELEPIRVRPARPSRPPMPPLIVGRERSLAPDDSPRRQFTDDDTISPERVAQLRAERLLRQTSETPAAAVDSLLGEIGGVPRVEVLSTRPVPIADPSETPARRARESYELRSRELERAAAERLQREQQRLELGIREQLAYGKRELESVLENRLEDTILRPAQLALPASRRDDAADGPADD